MSPELAFLLTLVLRMAITAAFVVTILGAGLRPVEKSLQKGELQFVQRGTCCASRGERPPTKPTTIVTSVTITFNEQKP